MNIDYKERVQLLLRLVPIISNVDCFAIHGDKEFLISYEEGNPLWDDSEYEKFKSYPSIQWKQLNIKKLKQNNPIKHKQGIDKLANWFKFND
jgi:hypothetical protein